jgi:hypothetical protein
MKDGMPRIKRISLGSHPERKTVLISWKGGGEDEVDLSDWIATGGKLLAPLAKSDIFRSASVADYGAAISWSGADLSIDATHLRMLADEQRPS